MREKKPDSGKVYRKSGKAGRAGGKAIFAQEREGVEKVSLGRGQGKKVFSSKAHWGTKLF